MKIIKRIIIIFGAVFILAFFWQFFGNSNLQYKEGIKRTEWINNLSASDRAFVEKYLEARPYAVLGENDRIYRIFDQGKGIKVNEEDYVILAWTVYDITGKKIDENRGVLSDIISVNTLSTEYKKLIKRMNVGGKCEIIFFVISSDGSIIGVDTHNIEIVDSQSYEQVYASQKKKAKDLRDEYLEKYPAAMSQSTRYGEVIINLFTTVDEEILDESQVYIVVENSRGQPLVSGVYKSGDLKKDAEWYRLIFFHLKKGSTFEVILPSGFIEHHLVLPGEDIIIRIDILPPGDTGKKP